MLIRSCPKLRDAKIETRGPQAAGVLDLVVIIHTFTESETVPLKVSRNKISLSLLFLTCKVSQSNALYKQDQNQLFLKEIMITFSEEKKYSIDGNNFNNFFSHFKFCQYMVTGYLLTHNNIFICIHDVFTCISNACVRSRIVTFK